MNRPVILLMPGQAYDEQFHDRAYVLFKTYTAAIIAAGGLPVLLLKPELAEEYAKVVDGVVITGTQEYAPADGLLKPCEHQERLDWEFPAIRAFMEAKKPILGICHGLQTLNVALGGTLKRRFKLTDGVEHCGTAHLVETKDASFVQKHLGKRFMVNSLHNTRIDVLAEDLVATALSPDGVIEATEHKSYPMYSFQWHPEKMRGDFPYPPEGPCTQGMFEDFIRICGENR